MEEPMRLNRMALIIAFCAACLISPLSASPAGSLGRSAAPADHARIATRSACSPQPFCVAQGGPVLYPHPLDTALGHPCAHPSGTTDLHYQVFSPSAGQGGPYPIVFGFQGSGYKSTSECDQGVDRWTHLNEEMRMWAANGFVAVNVEYHGSDATPPLFGNLSCTDAPHDCPKARWASFADGSPEWDLLPAIRWFLDCTGNPQQCGTVYGGDVTSPITVFGGSAGGHAALMLGVIGAMRGLSVGSAVAFSGMANPFLSEHAGYTPDARQVYAGYMQAGTSYGSNRFKFGSPYERIGTVPRTDLPPLYGGELDDGVRQRQECHHLLRSVQAGQ
jgi:hypothetical protein